MTSKDFIVLFINDNFNADNFVITYENDFTATLCDSANTLTIMAIPSYENDDFIISTKINGVKHLDYKLVNDLQGKKVWSVL